MDVLLLRGGQISGLVGLVLIAVAVAGRLAGRYMLGGYSTGSLMIGGIGAICIGCFLLLLLLAGRAAR